MKKSKLIILIIAVVVFIMIICSLFIIWIKGVFGIRGIYFEAIDTSKVSEVINPNYYYPNYFLYYDGNIYTLQGSVDLDYFAQNIENNYIGNVYSNCRYYWSTEEARLHKVTTKDQLYAVDGYNKDFRVAVKFYVETMQTDTIWVFERINDIWLKYGKDFYFDMLNINIGDKMYIASNNMKEEVTECDTESAEEFINAIFQSEFLEDDIFLKEELSALYEEEYYLIKLVGEGEIEEILILFENGYVLYENQNTNLVVKVPEAVVSNIIKLI